LPLVVILYSSIGILEDLLFTFELVNLPRYALVLLLTC